MIHNVFEENLRLAKQSSVIYKNIILFKKDRRGRRSLQVCLIFLIVGATTMFSKKTCGLPSGRPPFIKISLRFARVVEAPTPTGLCDICCFDCRGDQWSSVVYKNIIAICPGSRGRLPLPVCAVFVVFGVGATIGRPRAIRESPLRI